MRSDKWNPKIPRKDDGGCPKGWLHSGFSMRVTVTFDAVIEQFVYTLTNYGSPYTTMLDVYNYNIPREEILETLKQLMPGPYAIEENANLGILRVYCDEWLDDVVIQLANDSEKAILHRYSIDHWARPQGKTNALMKQLIKRVSYET